MLDLQSSVVPSLDCFLIFSWLHVYKSPAFPILAWIRLIYDLGGYLKKNGNT